MIRSIIIFLILTALAFIVMLLNKFFFKQKRHDAATDSMRALAFFFDLQLFHILVFMVGAIVLFFQGTLIESLLGYLSDVVNVSGYGKLRADWFVLEVRLLVVYVVYATIMEIISDKGTLGKQVLGIKLEKKVGALAVVVRNLLKPLSIVFWPIMIVLSKLSADRQWLHDRVSGTKIIKIN